MRRSAWPHISVPISMIEDDPMGPEEWGYYLLIVAQHAGAGGRMACEDPAMIAFLASEGLHPDPSSKVAWAGDRDQTLRFAAEGKLVVCGNPAFLADGASFAITRDRGRSVVLLEQENAASTGTPLTSVLLTLSRPA